jgi:hypothetical protein
MIPYTNIGYVQKMYTLILIYKTPIKYVVYYIIQVHIRQVLPIASVQPANYFL